jgi:hypothetical protein
VARPGRGKSAGYRTIVAHRQGVRLVFLHGFAKNESENITKKERVALGLLGDQYMNYSETVINQLVTDTSIIEVVR